MGLAPGWGQSRSQRKSSSFLSLATSPQGLRQKARPEDEVTSVSLPPGISALCPCRHRIQPPQGTAPPQGPSTLTGQDSTTSLGPLGKQNRERLRQTKPAPLRSFRGRWAGLRPPKCASSGVSKTALTFDYLLELREFIKSYYARQPREDVHREESEESWMLSFHCPLPVNSGCLHFPASNMCVALPTRAAHLSLHVQSFD